MRTCHTAHEKVVESSRDYRLGNALRRPICLALSSSTPTMFDNPHKSGRVVEGGGFMLNSLSAEELEFVKAIEKYKKERSQAFLSWSEVLGILKNLGYRKSEQHRRSRRAAKKKEVEL